MSNPQAQKLQFLVQSVLHNPSYKAHLLTLMARFNFTEERVIQGFLDYNLDIFGYGNEIYENPVIRFVLHLHNLLEGSWHQDKQSIVQEMIMSLQPKKIVDLGFGVPTAYVRHFLKKRNCTITLSDFSQDAVDFAKELLTVWDDTWEEIVTLKQHDLTQISPFIGEYDLYVMQDSIEHVQNPTGCLKEYVRLAPKQAYFLLTMPICPLIPMHHIAWESKDEAKAWLKECGLKVIKSASITTNPEVDLFAAGFTKSPEGYIVLCNKAGVSHEDTKRNLSSFYRKDAGEYN